MKFTRSDKSGPPPLNVAVSFDGKERVAGPFEGSFIIGREDTCDISIPVAAMSRKHAEVSYEEGSWSIRDLDSSNGTFCDGNRI